MKGRIDLYVGTVAFAGLIALMAASSTQRTDTLDPIMLAVLVALACVAQRVPVFLFRSSAISVSFAAVIAAYVLYGTGAAVLNDVLYLPGGATRQGFGAVDTNEAYRP